MKTARYYLVTLLLLAGAAQPLCAQSDDPAHARLLTTLAGHGEPVRSVAFSPDGQIPTVGLVTYYPFNGNANDESGNGNDGTEYGGVALTADRFGNANSAYSFDGVDDYINIPNTAEMGKGWTGVTATAWINPATLHNGNILAKDVWTGSENNALFHLLVYATGKVVLYLHTTTDIHAHVVSTTMVSGNTWYLVTGSYDGSFMKIYINGQIAGSTSMSGTLVSGYTQYDLDIGTKYQYPQGRGGFFNGLIDDIRIYDRALSEAEIQALYNEGTGIVVDVTPPSIMITSPAITRGMKKVQQEKTVLVRGKATDASGIFEVLVNGQEAALDAEGNFRAEVKLTVGENKIYVKATDIHGNEGGTSFTVIRETSAILVPEVARQESEFQFGKYHALLIAVQDYTDRSIHDLDYPIGDATTLRRVLLDKYTFSEGNIHLLKNPDRQAILGKFGELRRSLQPDDNLLVFYAGHGYWDADLRQGYWLPRDARQSDQAAWISNSDIRDQIRGLKAQHTLLISDACFSGGIFKTREAFLRPDMAIQKVYELPSRKALTSGNLKTVPDRSVFVEYLVKRLEQNTEPYLYSEKLYINMKDAVINNSPSNQTPLFGVVNGAGDEGGDFIFVRKQ